MVLKKVYFSQVYIIFEFLLFFVFIPFVANRFLEGWLKIIPLLLIAAFFFILLRMDPHFDQKVFLRLDKEHLRKSVGRVIFITVLLVWFTWWIFPDLLLYYPREEFEEYLITFILYPFASVIPQELIYRVYFFHRYRKIVPEKY